MTLSVTRGSLRTLSKGSGNVRRLVVDAAAKVNLTLEVLNRRPDGYHEISTVMHAVDLSDRLVLEEAPVCELHTSAPGVPTDERNLALRAALMLRDQAKVDRGVRITLEKRIPVAAGLGGGSTDAAAVLVGLNRLWELRWPVESLAELAVGLGMDVPFFLYGGAAVATGRGETLSPLGGSSLGLVLVNPKFPVSTAEMYGRVTPAVYSDGGRARLVTRAPGDASAGPGGRKPLQWARARGPGRLPADRADAGGPDGGGGAGRGDVGQRPDGIRNRALRGAGTADPGAGDARLLGVLGGADAARGSDPDQGNLMGRGQAARRGTLDPVFGGSNPPAPTTS